MKIFLAAPFFNDEARHQLTTLLAFIENMRHHVFCAMRDGKLVSKDAPEETRQKYFRLDVEEMYKSRVCVAMLDYPLPQNQRLQHVTAKYGADKVVQVQIPDTGTVFEMGLAYAQAIPIIGFAASLKSMNLMLSQSCITVVQDFDSLEQTLDLIMHGRFEEIERTRKELFQL